MAPKENRSIDDCIFCRIIADEIPSTRVYEDDAVLAFLDISPVAPGHSLVVPKAHYATMADMPFELGGPVMNALSLIGRAVMAATGAGGFNCMQNNFSAAGQVVFHVHWHIIPRFAGDGLSHWPHAPYADTEAMSSIAERIRKQI